MRKILAVLFVLVVLIGCGGGTTKPPAPIRPPIPPPVCDLDGKCEFPGETVGNCADCQAAPTPDPDPTPAPLCDAKPLQTDKWLTFGFYTLFSQAYEVDWERVACDLKASGFTGIYLHLNSGWNQRRDKPFYFLTYDPVKKVFTNKPNQEWRDQFEKMMTVFLNHGLKVCLSMGDRYFDSKWIKFVGPHPFVNNNIGFRWTKDYEFFNSLAGISKPPFVWISWKDLSVAQAGNWKPEGKAGPVMFEYFSWVLDKTAELMAKIPTGGVMFKVFNEQISGPTDRHEIIQWFQAEARKRGLKTSKRFLFAFDYNIRESSPAAYKQALFGSKPSWAVAKQNSFVKDVKFEIHSFGETFGLVQFNSWGVSMSDIFPSTDGVPSRMRAKPGNVSNREAGIAIAKANLLYGDIKMEECDIPEVDCAGFLLKPPKVAPGKIDWYGDKKLKMMDRWRVAIRHHQGYLQ